MQPGHVGVLADHILHHVEAAVLKIVIQGVKIGKICRAQQFTAVTALTIPRLGKDALFAVHKGAHIFLGGGFQTDAAALDVFGKQAVELHLVVKQVSVFGIIEEHIQIAADRAGHEGGPLLLGQIVKGEDLIVKVAGAVLLGAVQDVQQDGQLVSAGPLVYGFQHRVQLFKTGAAQNAQEIRFIGHKILLI